ncbi:MAG TPA: hypothetical protein VF771_12910, partial [Longimicrobiaceae bacterium]
ADTEMGDDWEDVQVALGLLAERMTPRPRRVSRHRLRATPDFREPARKPVNDAKRRRKAEKDARRRSRKRR